MTPAELLRSMAVVSLGLEYAQRHPEPDATCECFCHSMTGAREFACDCSSYGGRLIDRPRRRGGVLVSPAPVVGVLRRTRRARR